MTLNERVKFIFGVTDAMGVEGDAGSHWDGSLALVSLPEDYKKDLVYLLVLAAL